MYLPGLTIKFSKTPGKLGPVPTPGQHTDEVLGGLLGYDAGRIEALRAAGVKGRVITRAVRFLRRFQRRGGGFELVRGRGPDAQSTAWAIQAFFAAGVQPPRSAFRYLARMRRPDGSYRYDARTATTPVWVTAQVLPALAGKPYPLR
jgi:hypothetical protein